MPRLTLKRIKATFGRNVRERRLLLNMSQAELAERAELRRAAISDIEREAANPTLDSITKIAAALRVDVCELFDLHL